MVFYLNPFQSTTRRQVVKTSHRAFLLLLDHRDRKSLVFGIKSASVYNDLIFSFEYIRLLGVKVFQKSSFVSGYQSAIFCAFSFMYKVCIIKRACEWVCLSLWVGDVESIHRLLWYHQKKRIIQRKCRLS